MVKKMDYTRINELDLLIEIMNQNRQAARSIKLKSLLDRITQQFDPSNEKLLKLYLVRFLV